jgi:hypothetical protein
MLHSYSSVFGMGHKSLEGLWDGTVVVQEKIDGSQFSFGVIEGELHARSKGATLMVPDCGPGNMFQKALNTALGLFQDGKLVEGWTYRGEFLGKPKHNTLCYGRVPIANVILFDIDRGNCDYLAQDEVELVAYNLGLECAPTFAYWDGQRPLSDALELLDRESILGGTKVEGVVLKNYGQFTPDKKTMMGKIVSEDFKERHSGEWKKANPGTNDVVSNLIEMFTTEARWSKAVQHLRERGALQGAPQDIPALMREVNADVLAECGEEIKERLFSHFWKKEISRGVTKGLPEWYKRSLAESLFGQSE